MTHPFEEAGFGTAPFTFIERKKRPGSKCAYCGKAISYVYFCESADKRSVGVGSECIKKVESYSFIQGMERQIKEQEKVALPDRIEHARNLLAADPKFLLDLPHPKRSGTLRGYVEYLLER